MPDKLPHWDMSNIYPALSSQEFKADMELLKTMIADMQAFQEENNISSQLEEPYPSIPNLSKTAAGYIDRMNKLLEKKERLEAYIYGFISTDSYNDEAKKAYSMMDPHTVALTQIDNRFTGWIGKVYDCCLENMVSLSDIVKDHSFYLSEAARQSKYMMSPVEEDLTSELMTTGASAWTKLHGTVTSQVKVDLEIDGKVETLPITAVQNIRRFDPREDLRRKAFEAEMAGWDSIKEPIAAAMNAIKGTNNILNKRRNREDSLHASLDQSRIDRSTLEAMLQAMEESFPMFRKYWAAKAKRLGKDKLAFWDIEAPIGESSTKFTYEEAKNLILEQFEKFSPKLSTFAKRAFDNNWIDAEPRDGKLGGGFCMRIGELKESRILCNFDGSLDQTSTIAHELGHAFHNDCCGDKTSLQIITPMTLAETASVICETILIEASLENASSKEEELAILETALITDSQIVVDIYSRYLFEKEVFETREDAELSADELSQIMLKAQKATYGDALDERYLNHYMWLWKPHYYSLDFSYYNYPYTFGLLFSTGLYAVYKERGDAFVDDYIDRLSSTGEGNAAELAARFGIDIRNPQFWKDSLKVVEEKIERYISL